MRGAALRLLQIIEGHLQTAVASVAAERDPFASSVHEAVAHELPSGAVELERVARALSLSARTLQRRLSERGLAFRTVVDDVRRELAVRYIREANMSLTELSLLLGFSELSAFSRAFRRWTGTSPQQFERAR